ncbi:TPA: 4Fe-4S cluster-binding domain-containing protein, partial [Escherichia coli]|nr:4Fe-4S cluster-binding domain-containing protein [Escherichia coli]
EHINVLVDGKFVQDLHDPMLIWRGSSNQVIHYLR